MIHSTSFTPPNPHSDHLAGLTWYLLEERGGGGGRVAEMSIFTDEIISREADNMRDIISGAISIFISGRQQTQPTNIINTHSRAYIALIVQTSTEPGYWRSGSLVELLDSSQYCCLTTRWAWVLCQPGLCLVSRQIIVDIRTSENHWARINIALCSTAPVISIVSYTISIIIL